MEKKLNSQNFESEVLQNDKVVLVDFYADWCGPCTMLAPIIEEISNERDDIVVGKVNVDEAPDIAAQYGIVSIPTLIVFKHGRRMTVSVGFQSKQKILEMIDALV